MSRLTALLGIARPARITTLDDLRKGAVEAVGTLTCQAPITSPIRGRSCAGYLYRASHLGWRTVGPATRKLLTQALVYASPLGLSLADGAEVLLAPRRSDDFDAEGHRLLAERDLPGFLARETLLLPGASVLVHGKARCHDREWTILFDRITPQ